MLAWHGIEADPLDLQLHAPDASSPRPGAAVVHPGAAYGSRRWPVDRFARVCRELDHAGKEVVLTGSGTERERALAVARAAGMPEASVLAGRIGLDQMAALVQEASVVISADTGAAHLASAYARPSVVMFGPAPVEEWGPPPGPHRVLTDASRRRGDAFAADPDPALLAVEVEDVLDALTDLGVMR